LAQALAVNDIIKAQLWSSDSEQASVNTFHYRVTAVTGIVPSLTDFLTVFDTTAAAPYKALLSNHATYNGAVAQIVFPLPLRVAEKTSVSAGAGGGAGAGLPRQACGLISWTTPLAGPGGRGRTYIPFLSDADTELNGQASAAYKALAGTFATAISVMTNVPGGAGSATVELGIRHGTTASFTAFTGGSVSGQFATQKRRGSFGRPNSSPF